MIRLPSIDFARGCRFGSKIIDFIRIVVETDKGCVYGASALGSEDASPHQLSKQVAQRLIYSLRSGGCVDLHAQDQLILYMALASGTLIVPYPSPYCTDFFESRRVCSQDWALNSAQSLSDSIGSTPHHCPVSAAAICRR